MIVVIIRIQFDNMYEGYISQLTISIFSNNMKK